ncbi:hypothetical protein HOK021_36820 [Streptomyces hygroscopicus]|nr:hypothetical protein HOK021_36820 [Streptomyces hygroscopicus]
MAAAAVAASVTTTRPADTAVRMEMRLEVSFEVCPEVRLRMGGPPEARRTSGGLN